MRTSIKDIPDFLNEAGVEGAVRLAIVLRHLRQRRSGADYHDEIGNPRKLAQLSLSDARDVVGVIGELP